MVGIPVFPSRAFRHSALFVREDDPIEDPARLAGGRIGIPEWTQTATVYVRGFLAEQYGIDLTTVSWVQGGVNEPGRVEGIPIDHRAVEAAHHRETGIFPIMHLIALRGDVYDRDPWVAMNLLTALEEAKRRSLARLSEANTARIPLPWAFSYANEARDTFGGDFWPYGIEPNRPTLQAFLRYAHDQGVTARPLGVEELFVPEVREAYRI